MCGEEVGVVRVTPCAHAPGGDTVLGGNLGGVVSLDCLSEGKREFDSAEKTQ